MPNHPAHVDLTQQIKSRAIELGFARPGVCPAVEAPGLSRFSAWLDAGYDGQMRYLRARQPAYQHPQSVLEGVRSVVVLTMNYRTLEPRPVATGEGRISRYAWGSGDYHDLIHDRLRCLKKYVEELRPDSSIRGVVDTAPLLERDYAQLAGLGWIGKNTLLIHPASGSYFFLAALLVDFELEYDAAFESDHCGSCRACLDACPTQAFPQPYVLDATRCISYLTIELRESIPAHLRSGIGDWLFGCDVCQDVCPWNGKAPQSEVSEFQPRSDTNPLQLADLFRESDESFRTRFRLTPLWRAKRRGILRNAAIVLGNQRDPNSCMALSLGLHDCESLVREACAWALGELATPESRTALRDRALVESDPTVRRALEDGLQS